MMGFAQAGRMSLRGVLGGMLIVVLPAFAQTESRLEQFERDATRPRTTASPTYTAPVAAPYRPLSSDAHSGLQESGRDWGIELIQMVPAAMLVGGAYSWKRVAPVTAEDSHGEQAGTPRSVGEGVIPYARLDASTIRVNSRIHAIGARAEVGYGPFGLELRQLRYTETDPRAVLDIRQYHALYRMSAGDYVEIDLGLGRLHLDGVSRNSGPSWTLPLIIQPSTRWSIELRPSWATLNGTSVSHHELAVSLGDRFWAVRAGYQWMESPTERLDGPFLGLSIRL